MLIEEAVLVTGGAGFIGSHLVEQLVSSYPSTKIVVIDLLTYAGELGRLDSIKDNPNFEFVRGNIKNKELLEKLFEDYRFTKVYHLAAETHVDNSIHLPQIFFDTNIMGTYQLLEVCRQYWIEDVNKLKSEYSNARFLHISTDEVYGSLGEKGFFTENTKYHPSSPYSASKAASDLIVEAYFKTFNLPVIICNCSNNYGPRQESEKLIPKIITSAIDGKEIPIYGDGKNVRDWLYVKEHVEALEYVIHNGEIGEYYNIGINNEWSNIKLADYICKYLQQIMPNEDFEYSALIKFTKDRPGHDIRYALDCSKLKALGWKPKYNIEKTLEDTIKWYVGQYG